MTAFLTIAVPTFNRCTYLERLLDALVEATAEIGDAVELLVSDNASTDATSDVLDRIAANAPGARIFRNPVNIGADANIRQCLEQAAGEYVWIVGDDDLPKRGAIPAILQMLRAETPDIAYLPSEWVASAISTDQGAPFDAGSYDIVDGLTFGRRVNVFLTFLSGIVVRAPTEHSDQALIASGSNLSQLGWVLPALKRGTRFAIFRDAPIVATGGNSGGYAVVEVFGVTLSAMVAKVFGRGSAMYRAIVGRTVTAYLPQLIWNVRNGSGGRFVVDLPWAAMRREIGDRPAYWSFVVPVGRAPRPVARAVLLAARVTAKAARLWRG